MYTLFRKSQFKNALPASLGCRTMLLLLLSMCILLSAMPLEAQAAAGSYTIKWYAADPELNKAPYLPTYAKYTPTNAPLTFPPRGATGRYADPLTNAVAYGPTNSTNNLDAVTSLMPKDMALGQIVPFEIEIKVTGSTTPENGVISFTGGWDTNGDNFGYDPDYMVYCAFVDFGDKGTIDPGNNAKVDSITSTLVGSGSKKEIQGTIQVSGLDNGDNVIVEVWVVLKSTISSDPKPTGNIQSRLVKAQTVAPSPGTIGSGNQVVSLVQLGDFFSANADVSVIKNDSPDPVIQGGQLTYNLTVKNNAASTTANGVVVTDTLSPSTTLVSASGASYTISGNNVIFNVGGLSPGESKTLRIISNVSYTAPTGNDTTTTSEPGGTSLPTLYDIYNKASVSTTVSTDTNTANNIYYQPTNVLAANPSLTLTKSAFPTTYSTVGQTITYTYVVTNSGNVDISGPITVTDNKIGTVTISSSSLAVGASGSGTATYTITQADLNNSSVTNTAYASGTFDSKTINSATDEETVRLSTYTYAYTYPHNSTFAECGYDVILNVNSSTSDGRAMRVNWTYNSNVSKSDYVTKGPGNNYTSIYRIPDGSGGEWFVYITEYDTNGIQLSVADTKDSFSVICTIPEFLTGSFIAMLLAGAVYLVMRRNMAGFLNGKR
jgi:uncharacterized repeat protein (TIGR01451 family)